MWIHVARSRGGVGFPGWRRSVRTGWLGCSVKVLRIRKVRSGFSLFGEDQLVAPGHKEAVAVSAVLDDQLPAAAEEVFARYRLRLGRCRRFRFRIGWR